MDLQVVLDDQNVAKENAAKLLEAFGAPFTEAGKILSTYKDIVVTDESQKELMADAREKRLALKKIRTGVENKRKELKEDALRTSQAIDGVAKYIKDTIQPAEEYLELQEKFAETKAAERAAALKADRIKALSAYSDDLSVYDFDSMTDETFQKLLNELKSAHEAKLAEAKRLEDERIAKEKADAEAAEAQRLENERLKAEAEAKQKEEAAKEALRQKRISERTEQLKSIGMPINEVVFGFRISGLDLTVEDEEWETILKEAKKRIQMDAEKKAEDVRIAKEQAEKLAKEREAREKLEKEARDREAAEAKKKAEAEEAERQALLAPDKEKLLNFGSALEVIRRQKLPAVKTKQAQDVVNLIDEMLTKMQKIITEKAEEL